MIRVLQEIFERSIARLSQHLITYAPPLIVAAIILLVVSAATALRWLISKAIKAAALDKFLRDSGLTSVVDRSGRLRAASLLAGAAYWVILGIGLLTALDVFGHYVYFPNGRVDRICHSQVVNCSNSARGFLAVAIFGPERPGMGRERGRAICPASGNGGESDHSFCRRRRRRRYAGICGTRVLCRVRDPRRRGGSCGQYRRGPDFEVGSRSVIE